MPLLSTQLRNKNSCFSTFDQDSRSTREVRARLVREASALKVKPVRFARIAAFKPYRHDRGHCPQLDREQNPRFAARYFVPTDCLIITFASNGYRGRGGREEMRAEALHRLKM